VQTVASIGIDQNQSIHLEHLLTVSGAGFPQGANDAEDRSWLTGEKDRRRCIPVSKVTCACVIAAGSASVSVMLAGSELEIQRLVPLMAWLAGT
jgi:hypothetical protein